MFKIFFCRSSTRNLWLDGHHEGNKAWRTYSYRELDTNKDPTLVPDLSLSRQWYSETSDTENEFFEPRRLPLKDLLYSPGYCNNDTDDIFQVTGV